MKRTTRWSISSFMPLLLIPFCSSAISSPRSSENKQKVTIVESGKSDYQILIRAQAPPSWDLAAKELQRYLKKVGAVDVPIVRETKNGQKYIVIGSHPALPVSSKYDSALYQNERFMIDLTPEKNLVIMGGNESKDPEYSMNGNFGVLYGTYELIERYLGVRWYAPGEFGECFYEKQTVEITDLPFEHQPPFDSRHYWPWIIDEATAQESKDFYLHLRSGGSKNFNPSHSFGHFSKFTKTHPEIFALMVNGNRNVGQLNPKTKKWDVYPQVCLSNPKTLDLFKETVDDWYSGSEERKKVWLGTENNLTPTDDFIYVCPNDNYSGQVCQCPMCMAKYNKKANFSGTSSLVVFDFVKKVAEWAGKKYPDKKVGFLAYEGYQDIPENFLFPQNVIVRLCVNPYLIYWGIPDYRSRIDKRLADWKKTGAEVSAWQYYMSYDVNPYLVPHLIVDFYRKHQGFLTSVFTEINDPFTDKRPYKINTIHPKGTIPNRDFVLVQLNLFFTQKVLWGTNFDVDDELNRYYKLFFGPAAIPMKKHYDLLIQRWENPPETVKPLPASVYAVSYSGEDKMSEIYNAEVIKSLSDSLAEALQLVEKGSIYEKRLNWIKTTYFDEFKKKAEIFQKEKGIRFMAVRNSPQQTDMPDIDGQMNDKFWENLRWIEMFDSGGPVAPRFPTNFKCAVRNGILYIGVQANDPDVLNLKRNCRNHDADSLFGDDVLELFISPNTETPDDYYQVAINLNQSVFDSHHKNGKSDSMWHSDVKSASSTNENSWTMEIALPLKSFGITDLNEEKTIRFNLCRSKRSGTQENYELQQWMPSDRSFHKFNGFGVMSIYSNDAKYENLQTYQSNKIRKSYVNIGVDGEKKQEDTQIQYLVQPFGGKVQIDYNAAQGGTAQGIICFDRFKGLEIGPEDCFEIKFRNPPPGLDGMVAYSITNEDDTVRGDYFRVSRGNPSPSWQTNSWNIYSEGYSAKKEMQDGKPWKGPKKISGVQCYFYPNGAISGQEKRDFEIEYIRLTQKTIKKVVKKE